MGQVMNPDRLTRIILALSVGFFALALGLRGLSGGLVATVLWGLLGLVGQVDERRGRLWDGLLLTWGTVLAAWGVLQGAQPLLLGLALIGTLALWVLKPAVRREADLRLWRLGKLALLAGLSLILGLYLPLKLSFPAALALAALGAGGLLAVLKSAGRLS